MKNAFVATSVVFALLFQVIAQAMPNPPQQFVPVFEDRYNNLIWSAALPGYYTNGCVNNNGYYDKNKCTFEIGADGSFQVKVDDSMAAKVCRSIGARLPTMLEFESLVRNFDHEEYIQGGALLTKKGQDDMQAIFRDMDQNFWTSTIDSQSARLSRYFSASWGGIDYYGSYLRNSNDNTARCVK